MTLSFVIPILLLIILWGYQPERMIATFYVTTGPPTHSVGPILFCWPCVCRRRLFSFGVCNSPRHNVTHQGAAHGGPAV